MDRNRNYDRRDERRSFRPEEGNGGLSKFLGIILFMLVGFLIVGIFYAMNTDTNIFKINNKHNTITTDSPAPNDNRTAPDARTPQRDAPKELDNTGRTETRETNN